MHERAQHHVFQDGQAGYGLHDLKGASNAEAGSAIWRHFGNIFSLKANYAFIGMEKSADQIEYCRLASAVWADDEQDLARVHRQ